MSKIVCFSLFIIKIENPVRTYHQLKLSQQRTVPQQMPNENQLNHQQPEQKVPTHLNITQTAIQQQLSPQIDSSPSYSPVSSQSIIPPAPPLLDNFNIQPNYSDQKIKILNDGLQDQPLYPTTETVFECQFSGQPNKIQWFHNGIEIMNYPQQIDTRSVRLKILTKAFLF